MIRLLPFIDRLVPASLREDDRPENLYRARVMIVIPLVIGAAHICTSVLIYWLGDRLGDFQWVFWLAIFSSFLLLLSVYVFRQTSSFVLGANLYGLGATLAMLSVVLITGGFEQSPIMILGPLVVLFTFIMASIRTALFWAGCVLALWLIGVTVEDIHYINAIPSQWSHAIKVGTVINAGVALMGVLWIFDLFYRQLLKRLQIERDRALFTAAHDVLTGLANRKTFENRLFHLIEHQRVTGGMSALLLLDLNDFKRINDTYGHASGDAVLKAVAAGMKSCVRYSDLAARLGGDEFALLLSDVKTLDTLMPIIEKIHRTVTAPVVLDNDEQVAVGASIGIALLPNDGNDPQILLHSADQAMYGAKDSATGYLFARDIAINRKPHNP